MRSFFAEKTLEGTGVIDDLRRRFGSLEWIEDYQAFRKESMQREKECVVFALKRGAWLKPFHCYRNTEYSYYSLDLAEGCLFDCVYCYLQSYLNHGALVLFVNTDELIRELQLIKGERLWISTGLLTDSLLAETYFPVLPGLSRAVPEGAVLELRSKSAEMNLLADPQIDRSRLVVSFSMNPVHVANRYEFRAASVAGRLEAARSAVDMGYRIAFHLDPVLYYDGWYEGYRDLMRELQTFPVSRIAFLSLGLFRYMPGLGAVIRKRFPMHPLMTEEFFPADDGKYHYFRPIRKEMYRAFNEWLRPWNEVPVFWSMEPDDRLVEELSRDGSQTRLQIE